MNRSVWALIILFATSSASASELVHQFSSPSFSGIGYSSHVLTIEQLETQRKQKIKDDKQAELDKAERELKSTNAYKFQNNLESRIYAQLSKQIADAMFGEGNPATFNSADDWISSETPFGDKIEWQRWDNQINVKVYNSNGELTAEFSVPVGEFAF
jgi:hypothetical protein